MTMKRLLAILICLVAAPPGWAHGPWRDLPREDRQQMRQQMREHWQQERATMRDEGAPRWRDLPDEDRRRLRDEMRGQRAWPDPRGPQPDPRGPRDFERDWRR